MRDGSENPSGWEFETPRYRITRAIYPSPNSRHKFEPPFSTIFDSNVWQFADCPHAAREEISTRHWPHPSFFPLNEAARRVLSYFNRSMKSRLPVSPWSGDRLRLDDGLSGPQQPNIKIGATAA
jgi:hypothetical protein